MRPTFEGSQDRTVGGLDVGGRGEALARAGVERLTAAEPRHGLPIYSREGPPLHQDPDTPGATRIGLNGRDDHSSSAPTPAAAAFTPRTSFTLVSTSVMSAGLSRRKSFAFSRP